MIELTQRQRSQAFRALLDVYRAEGRTMWFRGQGHSMTPLIWPNDAVLVELGVVPAGPGDIVLFWLNDRMIAHRVVALRHADGTAYVVAKGDAAAYADPTMRLDDVIGVVRAIKRGANEQLVTIGCSGRQARMIAHVSRWSGRSASKIGRFAEHLPAGVQASAMCLIPLTARATAQALWTPLQWMARISLTTIFIGRR